MSLLKAIVLIIISPMKLAFIFFLLALLSRKLAKPRLAKGLFTLCFAWILVFSQDYVADLLLYPLEHGYQSRISSETASADTAFVLPLACYYQTDGDIPETSRWPECSLLRMLVAKDIANQNNSELIVTGGHFLRDAKVNYGEKAKQFLIAQGVTADRILLAGEGTNTREELIGVKAIIGDQALTIVTSSTHRYRVDQLTKELELNAQVVGADFNSSGKLTPYLGLPSAIALVKTRSAFYEYFAILKYYIESD